jgi:xylan 1,4-beta-xylosidase
MRIKSIIIILISLQVIKGIGQNKEAFSTIQVNDKPVVLTVNLAEEIGPMDPIWAWFGFDECNFTYTENGKKLLSEISSLSAVPVNVRVHNLLTSDEGKPGLKWGSTNAYSEDENGNPVYDWTTLDKILDTFIERGMKPIMELGFTPKALSANPNPYRHNFPENRSFDDFATGWAYPPNDYKKWAELVAELTRHCIQRYGQQEVESWYWEVWNEPDITIYFKGTKEDYFKMYDYAVGAVKKVCPKAKVGGPTTTDPREESAAEFLYAFLEHCQYGTNYLTGEKGSPLDYITFHIKGKPALVDNHVQMNINLQLISLQKGFEILSSFPKFKHLPVILGESDPEGCAACSLKDNPNLDYRNGTLYPAYQAAVFARKYALADAFNMNLTGAVTWSFLFENQRWFDGFRDLATNGVNKPVLNIYRMFGMMSGTRVNVSGGKYDLTTMIENGVKGEEADINALACKDDNSVSVMVWNYHDDDLPASASAVKIEIDGLTAKNIMVQEYRIDKNNSNSFEVWKKMGSPQFPDVEQITELEKAGQLQLYSSPQWINVSNDKTAMNIELPRQGVSLLKFSWNNSNR